MQRRMSLRTWRRRRPRTRLLPRAAPRLPDVKSVVVTKSAFSSLLCHRASASGRWQNCILGTASSSSATSYSAAGQQKQIVI